MLASATTTRAAAGRCGRGVSSHASHVGASSRASASGGIAPVVERTLSWLNRFRQLKVRYERRADIHQAFLSLGCALICWRTITNQKEKELD